MFTTETGIGVVVMVDFEAFWSFTPLKKYKNAVTVNISCAVIRIAVSISIFIFPSCLQTVFTKTEKICKTFKTVGLCPNTPTIF